VNEELDRLTSNFSALITQQQRQLDEGIRSVADALRRAADRLADLAPPAGSAAAAAPGAAARPAGAAGAAGAAGVLAVRVINDSGSPVPVILAPGGQAQERPSRGGFWGVASGIAGGIGSFIGGLAGGLFGGGVGGAVFGGELIAALHEARGLLDRVDRLFAEIRAFGLELVRQIGNLVTLLFMKLTEAGVFPISSLFATLLAFIDLGVAVVLAQLRVVIDWVRQVAGTLVTWLGRFVNALLDWISKASAGLSSFAEQLGARLVRDVVRSLAESLGAVLLGSALAMGAIISESLNYAWEVALNKLTILVSKYAGLIYGVSIPPPPAPPASYADTVGAAVRSALAMGRMVAEGWVQGILGPAPPGPAAPPPGQVPPGPAAPLPGPPPPGPAAPLRLTLPRFIAPELKLPEFPQITPQLDRLLGAPAPAAPGPAAGAAGGPAAPSGPAAGPVTLNGGITVQVLAQTLDREHADETARVIARSMLDELRRLTERERLRSGLPTAAIS